MVLLAWSAAQDAHGPAASADSSRSGAAFCASYPGTSATNASFNGVVACSGPDYTGSIAYDGHLTQAGTSASHGGSWQCTEFASRYFAAVTGRSAPLAATGAQWVAHVHKTLPRYGLGGGNGTGAFAPSIVPGVIISMRGGPYADPLGHVAVVTAVSVTHGNGSITVVGENDAGFSTIQVVNGTMSYGSSSDLNGRYYYTSFQWLTGLPRGNGGAPYANGALVRTPDDAVYVIAGDAPLRLGSCAYTATPDCSGAVDIADLSGFLPIPPDGTILHDGTTGDMYVVAGGAPLRLGSCSFTPGGNCATAVTVDDYPIATLDHLQPTPADGTLLHDATNGRMYIVAGGAPLRLGTCAFTPGRYCATAVTIDDYAIAALDHLSSVPADDTVLHDATNGRMFIVAGGAPLRLGSCAFTPGGYCATAVTIDGYPLARHDHLRAVPIDGTVLHDATTGDVYRVNDGSARRLSSCSSTPGGNCETAVTIDRYALAVLAQ